MYKNLTNTNEIQSRSNKKIITKTTPGTKSDTRSKNEGQNEIYKKPRLFINNKSRIPLSTTSASKTNNRAMFRTEYFTKIDLTSKGSLTRPMYGDKAGTNKDPIKTTTLRHEYLTTPNININKIPSKISTSTKNLVRKSIETTPKESIISGKKGNRNKQGTCCQDGCCKRR